MTRAGTVERILGTCTLASPATRTLPFAVSTVTLEGCIALPATEGVHTCRLAPVSTTQPGHGRSARSQSCACAAVLPPGRRPAPVHTRSTATGAFVAPPWPPRAPPRRRRGGEGACVLGRPPLTFLAAPQNRQRVQRASPRSARPSCSSWLPGRPRRRRRLPWHPPLRCTRSECVPTRRT